LTEIQKQKTTIKTHTTVMNERQKIKSSSVIIYDSDLRVLLSKRSASKSMDPGLWETIGGTIEEGESSLAAITREVSEELGNDIILKNTEFFNQYRYETKSVKLISDVFIAQIEGHLSPSTEEIEEVKWFEKEEALELDFCLNCKQRLEDFYRAYA